MPDLQRPDGTTIHYETYGSGYPVLLLAPGGVNSEIDFWSRSTINPIEVFRDEFMLIGMDQRFAGRSFAPAKAFAYDDTLDDQLAVLDAVGVERAHVMGGCIGCLYAWRLIHDAPHRISAAVCQDPVGLDATNNLGVFFKMFDETFRCAREHGVEGVVASAMDNPLFMANNAAGPFAARIAADGAFREEMRAMRREVYINLVIRFRDGLWPDNPPYFTVSQEWMRGCPAPMLVLPGSDPFHPSSIGAAVCEDAPRASCLGVDARADGTLSDTIQAIRSFLRAHASNEEPMGDR